MNNIILVKWSDSRMYIIEETRDSDFDIATITSVGVLIHEDKEKIILAGDVIDDDVRRVIAIPKVNILEKKVIHKY